MLPLLAALALTALSASPAAAKRAQCPPQRIEQLVALVGDSAGNVAVIVASYRGRMPTEDVQCWAKTGDKSMQLELAKRLEAGDGIARDVEAAENLYEAAGTPKSGMMAIYVPGIMGKPGTVMMHRIGPDVPGLSEAVFRRALLHIEHRASKPSYRKGWKLLERAAKQGYAPAAEKIAELKRIRA